LCSLPLTNQISRAPGLKWGEIKKQAESDALLLAGVGGLILAVHTKEQWKNNKPSGIHTHAAFDTYDKISALNLWLVSSSSDVPAGLTIKTRLSVHPVVTPNEDGTYDIVPDGIPSGYMEILDRKIQEYEEKWGEIPSYGETFPIRLLPRRIPACDWHHIRGYLSGKLVADWSNPQPGETPDEHELALMRGVLTEDQQRALKLSLMEAEQAKQAKQQAETDLKAQVEELRTMVAHAAEALGEDPSDFKGRVMAHLAEHGITGFNTDNIEQGLELVTSYIDAHVTPA